MKPTFDADFEILEFLRKNPMRRSQEIVDHFDGRLGERTTRAHIRRLVVAGKITTHLMLADLRKPKYRISKSYEIGLEAENKPAISCSSTN